jgi:antitoxin ParD1/3/4
MPMVTVSISPLQAADIRAAIDDGTYVSSSEVVREALRLWDAARKIDGAPSARDCVPGQQMRGRYVRRSRSRTSAFRLINAVT